MMAAQGAVARPSSDGFDSGARLGGAFGPANCKGVEETVKLVSTAEAVFVPFVVVAELRAAFALGKRATENERVLRRFLLKPGVSVLYPDDQTPHHYAAAYRQLRVQQTPIPMNDVWIRLGTRP